MSFGERLVRIRIKRKMTQDELAEKLDVSRQTVYRWERGDALPDINQLNTLCTLFKVFPEYFIDPDINVNEEMGSRSVYIDKDKNSASSASCMALPIIGIILWAILIVLGVTGIVLFGSNLRILIYCLVVSFISLFGLIKSIVAIILHLK